MAEHKQTIKGKDKRTRKSAQGGRCRRLRTSDERDCCKCRSTNKRCVHRNIGGEDNFKEQFAQALALKLNFKTSQQANEKALRQLMNNKGSAYGVKQALQARAVIYDNILDPSWFVKNFDLSAKTKGVGQRREARAMLIGSVLLIAHYRFT